MPKGTGNLDSELQRFFSQAAEILAKNMRNALARLGEETVAYAKDRGPDESWIDHTQNLRSSIGYALYEHGYETIASVFSGMGSKGTAEGRKMISDLAKEYSNTAFALVVVAAMEYAEYVEALENKDVLASAELKAKAKVESVLQKAIDKSEKEIEKLGFDVTITI